MQVQEKEDIQAKLERDYDAQKQEYHLKVGYTSEIFLVYFPISNHSSANHAS